MSGRKLNLTEEQRAKRREQMRALNARKVVAPSSPEQPAAAPALELELDQEEDEDELELGELFDL